MMVVVVVTAIQYWLSFLEASLCEMGSCSSLWQAAITSKSHMQSNAGDSSLPNHLYAESSKSFWWISFFFFFFFYHLIGKWAKCQRGLIALDQTASKCQSQNWALYCLHHTALNPTELWLHELAALEKIRKNQPTPPTSTHTTTEGINLTLLNNTALLKIIKQTDDCGSLGF